MKKLSCRIAALLGRRVIVLAACFVAAVGVAVPQVAVGVLGIPIPYKNSSTSTIQIIRTGKELHFITENTRFLMHEFSSPTRGFQWSILRETYRRDQIEGQEGSNSNLALELLDGKRSKWRFQEIGKGGGIQGEIVSDYVYQITKYGCCDAPPTFVYFSLADGRKLGPEQDKVMPSDALEALDESIGKSIR
jgi:hypothetical protein